MTLKSKIQSYKARTQNWFHRRFGFVYRFKKKFNKSLTVAKQTGNINKYYMGLLLYIIAGIFLGFITARGIVYLINKSDDVPGGQLLQNSSEQLSDIDLSKAVEIATTSSNTKIANVQLDNNEDSTLANVSTTSTIDNNKQDSFWSSLNLLNFWSKDESEDKNTQSDIYKDDKTVEVEENNKFSQVSKEIEYKDLTIVNNNNSIIVSIPVSLENDQFVVDQKSDTRYLSIKDVSGAEGLSIANIYVSYEGDRKRDSLGYVKSNLANYVEDINGESLIMGDKTVMKVNAKSNPAKSWYLLPLQNANWLMVIETSYDKDKIESIIENIKFK